MILVLVAFGGVGLALCYEILLIWPIRTIVGALGTRSRHPGHAPVPMPMSPAPWQSRPRWLTPIRTPIPEPLCLNRGPRPLDTPRSTPPYARPAPCHPPRPPRLCTAYPFRWTVPISSRRLTFLNRPSPSRSRITKPRSTPAPCSWKRPSWNTAVPSASSKSTPARSSLSSRSSSKPACASQKSPAWPTTWRSPSLSPACASWRRFPARPRSASRSPTTDEAWSVSARSSPAPARGWKRCRIPLFLGKDVKGQALAFDLADMPHLLIAGRTGTGKSVCLNAMILSILMTRRPDEVQADPDRPQDGRTLAVQAHSAPDAPGRHRHEEGRIDPRLGLRQDGRALRLPGPRRGPQHPGLQCPRT